MAIRKKGLHSNSLVKAFLALQESLSLWILCGHIALWISGFLACVQAMVSAEASLIFRWSQT